MAAPAGVSVQSAAATAAVPSRSYVWNGSFDYTLLVAPIALGLLAAA